MKKIESIEILSNINGGFSVREFCVGYAAGVGAALSFGWTLGPVGIGVVVLAGAACLAGDS